MYFTSGSIISYKMTDKHNYPFFAISKSVQIPIVALLALIASVEKASRGY